ncbi:MAG: hypothetical protein JXJ22_10035 [Bacteroidales bacterium]|nr:hypothetical protein [Bacteroidales bacterium]
MIITREKKTEVLSNGLHLSPDPSNTIEEQLDDCHDQLQQNIAGLKRHVVLLVYFVNAQNSAEYNDLFNRIKKIHYAKFRAPFSIIAQPPVDGTMINVEVYHCTKAVIPEYKQFEGYPYCVFYHNNNKYLVSGGLQTRKFINDPLKQSMESFRLMKEILYGENMNFCNVYRQWNYIESIVDTVSDSQPYQIFNDVRSLFYNESEFNCGYPAATGIGMKTGGVIIDFLAARHHQVWPVRNPGQVDAHRYSAEVLAENKLSKKFTKSTPKFERAKAIDLDENILIYISGTAAIKGQKSIAQNDAYEQTLITLDNIRLLTDKKNIVDHNIPYSSASVIEPVSFRIYVKTIADLQKVQSAFKSRFGEMKNVLYLIADICRPELLVEIEGTYRLNKA